LELRSAAPRRRRIRRQNRIRQVVVPKPVAIDGKATPEGTKPIKRFHRARELLQAGGLYAARRDYDSHSQHGIKPQRGHGKRDADRAVIRWCFADASLAAAFASKFGA